MMVNQKMYLGPCPDGQFRHVYVKSIHMKRVAVEGVQRGDSCSVAVRPVKRKDAFTREDCRRGMVLVDSVPLIDGSMTAQF